METPSKALPIGTQVKFTPEWLDRLPPAEGRRYRERTAVIGGYRAQPGKEAPLPFLDFAKAGRRKPERLFEVPWERLKIVEPQESNG